MVIKMSMDLHQCQSSVLTDEGSWTELKFEYYEKVHECLAIVQHVVMNLYNIYF